jgi:hypothetical protein
MMLDFHYELASTYSSRSAARIEALAREASAFEVDAEAALAWEARSR